MRYFITGFVISLLSLLATDRIILAKEGETK